MKSVLYYLSTFLFLTSLNISQAFSQDAPVMTPGTSAPAAGGAAQPPPPGWMNFVLLGGMVLFMWLFIIRPQSKRQKEHKKFLDAMQVGQEVVTSSGFIGKVTQVTDSIVTIDLGSSSVRVLKSAISGKLDSSAVAKAG